MLNTMSGALLLLLAAAKAEAVSYGMAPLNPGAGIGGDANALKLLVFPVSFFLAVYTIGSVVWVSAKILAASGTLGRYFTVIFRRGLDR